MVLVSLAMGAAILLIFKSVLFNEAHYTQKHYRFIIVKKHYRLIIVKKPGQGTDFQSRCKFNPGLQIS